MDLFIRIYSIASQLGVAQYTTTLRPLQVVQNRTGIGNIPPSGRIRPARPFYAARWHLQKYDLISRIKPNTFYFFIRHLKRPQI